MGYRDTCNNLQTSGYGDTCNNPQTSPDAAVPWGEGARSTRKRWERFRLDTQLLRSQSVAGLIGDERVTSHLLSPPPLEPDQRVQGKVRNLEHSVATGLSGFPRAAHCLSLLCALANLIGLAALVHETH
jgi:hypothetical protein